jgi:hypothetical protein
MSSVSRRAALKSLGAGVGALTLWPSLSDEAVAAFVELQRTERAPALLFLSPAQYAAVETFTEAIIPADARSPGAKAARVADFIDLLLSESDDDLRNRWVSGLGELERTSQEQYRASFVGLNAAQRTELLTAMSRNERRPETPLEHFFQMTKDATIRGYYTSEIGIHKELQYKGNQHLPEFVGCKTVDGERCPHCGQEP